MKRDIPEFQEEIIERRSSIQTEEEYLEAIDQLYDPTFEDIRWFGVEYWKSFPAEDQNRYYRELNSGKAVIENIQQCATYLCAYGIKHEEKITKLLGQAPEAVFANDFDLVDWGCGQGLATMLLCDFLGTERTHIKTVTLIEPSPVTLERAEIYVKKFLPEVPVIPINRRFESIAPGQFAHCTCTTHIHLFANILDVPGIDLKVLVRLLHALRTSTDYFLCVNPAYQSSPRCNVFCPEECRMGVFTRLVDGDILSDVCDIYKEGGGQYRILKYPKTTIRK